MRLLILLLPFTILTIWVYAAISVTYRDIVVNHIFMKQVSRVEWYYLFADIFFTGIPLWLVTVYDLFRKWKIPLSLFDFFYLFMSYFFFMLMLISHMTRPFFWGTMLVLHIWFLILLVKTKSGA
jgi:hypothetical protein